jgi:hypothetical protein
MSSACKQPGSSTAIGAFRCLDFMMHEGMGGKHLFEVNVKTNDPTQTLKKLLVASDWVPQ